MVEVFKTNIEELLQAKWLMSKIHETFSHYEVNFDLDDCDNILRVECSRGLVEPRILIAFLKKYGCTAEVLKDEINLYPEAGKISKELSVNPG